MKKTLLATLFTVTFILYSHSQQPNKLNASEIYESVQKLNFLGSVLYVAAHPDDENTRLISYMANHVKARTAYLSLTRGDGGQNLIGPEIRELLGVIRTQELLAARRVDGGEQLFTRANDFGYSKHPDETLAIWNKDEVLSDVVWAIRQFKPDVIINRFDHRRAGETHGHHTSSALLSMEAFDLVNDKSKFSTQLKYVNTWQPKRLFYNTSWWRYGSQENFEKVDKKGMLSIDIGVYFKLKGMSNNEIASVASSQHLSQGFGRLSTRGSEQEYIEFLKGDFPEDTSNIFSGIDTSWSRVKGGKAVGDILYKVEKNFNFRDPSVHLNDLLNAYKLLQNIKDKHWKSIKTKELKSIIEACAGLYLEVSANTPTTSKGSDIILNFEALNRSNANLTLVSYNISSEDNSVEKNQPLAFNKKNTFKQPITLPQNIETTTPYWLENKGTLGMYKVNNQTLIGNPETPRGLTVNFNLQINNTPITITKNVVYRYSKLDKGELYRPFEIIPEVSASISNKVIIFENDKQKDIEVVVKAGRDNIDGSIGLDHPKDWNVYPANQKVTINNKGETQTLVFTVIPPKFQSEGTLVPKVTVNGKTYSKEIVEIDYSHIPFQTILLPSESKIVRLDIQKRGENIAYIEGAGDAVPESLQQIGYNIVKIKPEDITAESLSRFDAVVVGVRAYKTVPQLKFKQKDLLNFVEKGGNLIVQYNKTVRRGGANPQAPFNLKVSSDRVTEENAEVQFLAKDHSILNYPNKITQEDFEGWVQERGLYFPNEWSNEYTPILSMNDTGETPKQGSLLVAKYGKGYYIYTGLSFFREFPAGVSGAYRLFANMLSIGKDTINLNKKLTD